MSNLLKKLYKNLDIASKDNTLKKERKEFRERLKAPEFNKQKGNRFIIDPISLQSIKYVPPKAGEGNFKILNEIQENIKKSKKKSLELFKKENEKINKLFEKKKSKQCPEGYEKNLKTGRCNKKKKGKVMKNK